MALELPYLKEHEIHTGIRRSHNSTRVSARRTAQDKSRVLATRYRVIVPAVGVSGEVSLGELGNTLPEKVIPVEADNQVETRNVSWRARIRFLSPESGRLAAQDTDKGRDLIDGEMSRRMSAFVSILDGSLLR